nr:MAG TPA: hypothetical protein [Caudoviricetes sp.]
MSFSFPLFSASICFLRSSFMPSYISHANLCIA